MMEDVIVLNYSKQLNKLRWEVRVLGDQQVERKIELD